MGVVSFSLVGVVSLVCGLGATNRTVKCEKVLVASACTADLGTGGSGVPSGLTEWAGGCGSGVPSGLTEWAGGCGSGVPSGLKE